MLPPRTPCIRSFRAGAGRCSPPRTPCICSFGAGAGRCSPPPHSLHSLLLRWCWHRLAPPHSLHRLLWRWCGQTLRGFFFFAAPAPAALASSRLPRLRVLLLPTRAASSGPARCVLSPASSPMSPGPSSHKSIFKTAVYVCVHQISPYVCVRGGLKDHTNHFQKKQKVCCVCGACVMFWTLHKKKTQNLHDF